MKAKGMRIVKSKKDMNNSNCKSGIGMVDNCCEMEKMEKSKLIR